MNASLRDNILFGTPFDEPRYKRVLTPSTLNPTFSTLNPPHTINPQAALHHQPSTLPTP